MRARILAVIEAKPELSVRNVSLTAGLSDSALGKFLKNSNEDMKIENAKAVAKALGVDPVWLIFGEGDPEEAADMTAKIERMAQHQRDLIKRLIDEMPRNGTYG